MKAFLVALSIGVGVVVSGCAVGEPLETTDITNSSATTPVSETLTCTASNGYVTIGETPIDGADQDSFSASGACSGVALQPGASCTFSITFQPVNATEYRDYAANLTIQHDGTNEDESVGLDGDTGPYCC